MIENVKTHFGPSTPSILYVMSVLRICVCVTPRFELCKLFIAWRWKASWSLSGLLHRLQTHNIVLPLFFPPIITDTRYRSLISIKRHIWMCRAFYLWLASSFPCLSACSLCLFSPLRSDAYRHTHTHTIWLIEMWAAVHFSDELWADVACQHSNRCACPSGR